MKHDPRLIINATFLALCLLIAISILLGTFFLPRSSFSEAENRALSPAPTLSADSLISGTFFDSLSSFCADHIPLRSHLIRAHAISEHALGKQISGGVALLDGALVARCECPDLSLLEKNLSALSTLSENTVFCIVPRSVDVIGLPVIGASSDSALAALDVIKLSGLDDAHLTDALSAAHADGERVFYKTDHHLTSLGAYIAYRSLAEPLGFEPYEISDFRISTVSNSFLGTSYSSSGLLPVDADTVELWRYGGDTLYSVYCEDAYCSVSSLYDMDALDSKDKYRVFLGGNHSLLHVVGDGERQDLLIIKDSFANALIPFLARHYDITLIDPRYSSFSIAEYLSTHDFDAYLVLCGIDTLASDGSFSRVLF